jgi:hypothetical protein
MEADEESYYQNESPLRGGGKVTVVPDRASLI